MIVCLMDCLVTLCCCFGFEFADCCLDCLGLVVCCFVGLLRTIVFCVDVLWSGLGLAWCCFFGFDVCRCCVLLVVIIFFC